MLNASDPQKRIRKGSCLVFVEYWLRRDKARLFVN